VVNARSRLGDWEADTIIGKAHKQAIVSLTERQSGLALIYKVDRRTKENTEGAIKRLLESISEQVLTITSDNGKEFANHKAIANDLKCDFYFGHAIHPGKEEPMKTPMGSFDNIFLRTGTLEP